MTASHSPSQPPSAAGTTRIRAAARLQRQVAHIVAIVLVASSLPILTIEAAGQETDAADHALVVEPGPPPPPLSDQDRVPPLADLDEDGQRDPEAVPLSLPAVTPDELAPDVVVLPSQGAPEADLFAIGSTDAHAATVYPDQLNLEKQDGAWEKISSPARQELAHPPWPPPEARWCSR